MASDPAPAPGSILARRLVDLHWIQPLLALLGLWLVTSPSTFGYGGTPAGWNDVASGLVLVALVALAGLRRRPAYVYAQALLGVWLLFSPLLFWAPAAVIYANTTLIGILVISGSVLAAACLPMVGSAVPPGWSYNPSSWPQRAPIVALGFVGYLVSRHLAAFQLGYVDTAWDPLFGRGTERVLESDVSRWFPVSDAGLGATIYLVDALSAVGDERRWRTTPWMVAILGIAAIPLGAVSIVLVALQPTVVGAWCTLCLVQTAVTLTIVVLALDEVVAMLQFVAASGRQGRSAWRTFWMGGDLSQAEREPRPERRAAWNAPAMVWGVTASPTLFACAAIGAWVMFSPDVLGGSPPASDVIHVGGILVVTVSIVALSEVVRPLRFLNVPLGVGLVLGALLLPGMTAALVWSTAAAAVLLLVLSIPLGRIRDHYGDHDRRVRWLPARRVLSPAGK